MQYPDHDTAQKMPGIRTGWNQRCRRSIPQSGADTGRSLRDGEYPYLLLYACSSDHRNSCRRGNRTTGIVSAEKYTDSGIKVVKLRTHLLIKIPTCIKIVVNIF